MRTLFLICGIGYICFMTGMAVADIGKIPKPVSQPYDGGLPLLVFSVTFVPFLCGYLGGKSEK